MVVGSVMLATFVLMLVITIALCIYWIAKFIVSIYTGA